MSTVFKGENFSVKIYSRELRAVRQQFEVAVRPRIALCIPISKEGELIFLNQFRVAMNKVVLEFPAGRIEAGENPEHAIRREMVEEIGFRLDSVHLLGTLLTAPHFSDEVVMVFTGKGEIVTTPAPTPKEDLREIVTLTLSSVDKYIAEGRLIDSKSIAALALARAQGSQFGVSI
jgi:ADP-ribose pyrophosphatase